MFLHQHYLVESQVSNCCGQNLRSDPNGALTSFFTLHNKKQQITYGRNRTVLAYYIIVATASDRRNTVLGVHCVSVINVCVERGFTPAYCIMHRLDHFLNTAHSSY